MEASGLLAKLRGGKVSHLFELFKPLVGLVYSVDADTENGVGKDEVAAFLADLEIDAEMTAEIMAKNPAYQADYLKFLVFTHFCVDVFHRLTAA